MFNSQVFKTVRSFGTVIASVDKILDNVDQEQSELLKKSQTWSINW